MTKEKKNCDMCLMPFSKDPGQQTSPDYCSYCYKDGVLLGEGMSLKAFQSQSYEEMRASGMGWLPARFFTWSIRFASYWKRK